MPGAELLSDATRQWFAGAFETATDAQVGAWEAIARGDDTLVVAPTGSGKTLAAFLHAIDRLLIEPPPVERHRRCRVLYVSPLKALAVDVERNLRSPLVGIEREAGRLGIETNEIRIGLRTGDTPQAERARLATRPPDILITTPESLFLLLTSKARESLQGVDTVIIDEVHAVAGTKRGAHLALSLDRLDMLLDRPAQRIGLSATVSPIDEVARFIRAERPATVVAPVSVKRWDLQIRVPVEDMADLAVEAGIEGPAAHTSIWPHIDEQLVDLIEQHRTTLVFANSRRLAERITAQINEISAERTSAAGLPPVGPIARAHHGSVSKEQRSLIEEDLKVGRLPAVVATSSLELGIDMGAIDLVVQVETPPSVASGLQRVGRAGHQVGAVSRGIVFPKFRGDLVTSAVVVQRMRGGLIEDIRIPRNPLDVLAQQIVAAVAMDDWQVADLLDLCRRSASFTTLTPAVFESVLDMLSGRYPSDEFAELRPRLVWDRTTDLLTGRPGAQRLAVTSGGTIPDRGLFAVYLVGATRTEGARIGELDEEMVYESRTGDVIALGASSWRIEEITHDRVLVTPAPGHPGRLPFWKGDALGRPAALGEAVGAFVRGLSTARDPAALVATMDLDDRAAANLVSYIAEQRESTHHVPTDTMIVVERFRDELGDWRVVVHSPFGARVHAPWALALGARIRESVGLDAHVMHSDDGIVLRLPDTEDEAAAQSVAELIRIEPEEIEALVTAHVGGSALFAARFRECAARALLLPRRRPGQRSPLWQQRQRSSHLLEVASGYASFPIILETIRECLQDVYDVPALRDLLASLRDGRVRVHEVFTEHPSPFAQSLLFGYVASFLYEGDSPLAERRAEALTLDTRLLAELLGTPELRDLLDVDAIDEVEAELQRTAEAYRAKDLEGAADLLRMIGPLSDDDAGARGVDPAWLATLRDDRRAILVRIAGSPRTAAIEDAARLRDALGVALPVGIPEAHLAPVADPLGDLVGRFGRTHGPFTREAVTGSLGLASAVVDEVLQRLVESGRLVRGEFRPGGSHTEYCDPEVLRRVRRRSIAHLRHEIEPVTPERFAAFLTRWQHVPAHGSRAAARGVDGCYEVIEQLAGVSLPASTWLSGVFTARVDDFHPGMLDELTTSGDVVWWGESALSGGDGVVGIAPADRAHLLRPPALDAAEDLGPIERTVVDALAGGGAYFFRDISDRVSASNGITGDADVIEALWTLVWSGLVTNDSWAALRSRAGGGRAPRTPTRGRRGRLAMPSRTGPPAASGRWSLLPPITSSGTERARATGDALLDRYGIVTRGSVMAEHIDGGFSAVYRVLSAFEDAGRCRRTYAVDGLGAAQFALPVAVDQLRVRTDQNAEVVVLAASDPANAYGAALPWPAVEGATHRPARKAGALIVLVDGLPALYVERGGKSLLAWEIGAEELDAAAVALARSGPRLGMGRAPITRVNGSELADHPEIAHALGEAGFLSTPRGVRLPRTTA